MALVRMVVRRYNLKLSWTCSHCLVFVAEAKKAALRRVELSLDEADDLVSPGYRGLCTRTKRYEQLSQMQIEIQGIPTAIRGTYSPRLKRAQADLARYKKLSREAHAATRNSTSGGGWLRGLGGRGKADPADDAERGERDRLLVGTEMLDDGTRRVSSPIAFLEDACSAFDAHPNLRLQPLFSISHCFESG